jgi:hypothetical protein
VQHRQKNCESAKHLWCRRKTAKHVEISIALEQQTASGSDEDDLNVAPTVDGIWDDLKSVNQLR